MKEDFSNSEFYYQKALLVRKGEKTEPYKIATCAIERKDHNIANENLGVIVEERPYDVGMRFFYGLSFANLGNYLRAEQELSLAYKINPNDFIVKWFLDYIRLCLENNADTKNLLPFNYVKEIPNSVAKAWKKRIKDTAKNLEKINTSLKNKEFQNIIKWGLYSTEGEVMRDSAFILSTAFTPFCKKVIFYVFQNPRGRSFFP
jgi:tetratricopeptide (TPR) repeat protein